MWDLRIILNLGSGQLLSMLWTQIKTETKELTAKKTINNILEQKEQKQTLEKRKDKTILQVYFVQ